MPLLQVGKDFFLGVFYRKVNSNFFHTAVESMNMIIQGTIEYCRQRHTFDMPLIDNQYIHFKLAELQADVECLR